MGRLAPLDPNRTAVANAAIEILSTRVAEKVIQAKRRGRVLSDEELDRLIEAFLTRPGTTSRHYFQALHQFRKFMECATLRDAVREFFCLDGGAMNELLERYKNALAGRVVPATVNHRLSVMRSLAKKARFFGLSNATPEVEFLDRGAPSRDTSGPPAEKIEATIQFLADAGTPKALRDCAIIALLYFNALRKSEVLALKFPLDVKLEERTIYIRGKGRLTKEPIVLPNRTLSAIELHLDVRGRWDGWLFPSPWNKDRHLDPRQLYRTIREKYGLLRPHGLRHTAVTEALNRTNGNVRLVQKFARHKAIITTQLYDDMRQEEAKKVAALLAGEGQEWKADRPEKKARD